MEWRAQFQQKGWTCWPRPRLALDRTGLLRIEWPGQTNLPALAAAEREMDEA
jgi:hypothetical protein